MAKRHYIPITADVEGVDSDRTRALIRKAIRTALTAEGVAVPCEVDVLLTNDAGIPQINLDMREVDRPTDVLSFPEFEFVPGEPPTEEDEDCFYCHRPSASGRYGHLRGAREGTGKGVRPQCQA